MGAPEGEYLPTLEKEIPIALAELTSIMGWKNDEDPLHDYLLTTQHIAGIEKACSMDFPKHLNFFLTSFG